MKELYEYDTYLTSAPALFNCAIIEYDLKSANMSLAREFKLLPEAKIKELEAMAKEDRVKANGIIMRDNKEYAEKLSMAFKIARKLFMDANGLSNEDIVSIKRDAIFTNRYVKHKEITKHLHFRMKHEYTSFIHLKPLEIYFNNNTGLDIKGMDDQIYKECHASAFGQFLFQTIRKMERDGKAATLKYVRVFYDKYKWKCLDSDFYREFNAQSKFRYTDGTLALQEYRGSRFKDQWDIGYNLSILLNLIGILLL